MLMGSRTDLEYKEEIILEYTQRVQARLGVLR